MKKLRVYYLCHMVVNVILLIVFRNSIHLHLLSALPLCLMLFMAIQIARFKKETREALSDTAYPVGDPVRLTDEEQDLLYLYLKQSFFVLLPFEIPLIFFLPSYLKLLGLVPYLLAYILGGLVFKLKTGKQIQNRVNAEKKALEEQRKKEELGQM